MDLNGIVNMEEELKEAVQTAYSKAKTWLVNNSKFKVGDLVLFKQRFLDTIGVGKILHVDGFPLSWDIQYEVGSVDQSGEKIPDDKHYFNIPERDIITKVTI